MASKDLNTRTSKTLLLVPYAEHNWKVLRIEFSTELLIAQRIKKISSATHKAFHSKVRAKQVSALSSHLQLPITPGS